MPKRYYVCEVVEIFDEEFQQTRRVSKLETLSHLFPEGTSRAVVMNDAAPWALDFLGNDETDLPAFDDVQVYPLPEFPYVGALSAMSPNEKRKMEQAVSAKGATVPSLGNSAGFADFIRELGLQLDPNFNPDHFGLPR